ncbi:sugar phosphate isomerase/epimerase family protein [Streptomyces mirabilis]|nr:sugar phosphate isomerase/epimerase [Streptomyces mirabilis]
MPPVTFVALAADLGCRYISTALTSNPYNPSIYPSFSLRDDPTLRREMIAAMRDRDVSISLGEGMVVREGADIQDRVGDLEIMAELGHRRINTVSLVDTMHVVRSGSEPDDLARLDPGVIGYIQLSDAPLVPAIPKYMEEAMFERMVPGTGELPLLDVLEVLPRDLVIGLEIPLRAEAMAGVGPHERVGRCVDAACGLLARPTDQPHQA